MHPRFFQYYKRMVAVAAVYVLCVVGSIVLPSAMLNFTRIEVVQHESVAPSALIPVNWFEREPCITWESHYRQAPVVLRLEGPGLCFEEVPASSAGLGTLQRLEVGWPFKAAHYFARTNHSGVTVFGTPRLVLFAWFEAPPPFANSLRRQLPLTLDCISAGLNGVIWSSTMLTVAWIAGVLQRRVNFMFRRR